MAKIADLRQKRIDALKQMCEALCDEAARSKRCTCPGFETEHFPDCALYVLLRDAQALLAAPDPLP